MEEVERWGYPGLVMLTNDIWGEIGSQGKRS
jgi:hypothetical protein